MDITKARQMKQLKTHYPDLHKLVQSHKIDLAKAMQIALGRMNGQQDLTADELWLAIETKVNRQRGMPIMRGAQVEVGKFQSKVISLYRRTDDQIALYDGQGWTSRPIARWGRDFDYAWGAYKGMWKMTIEAQKNFQDFIAGPKPVARKVNTHRVFVR